MPTQPVSLIKGEKISIETDYRDALPVNMYAVERKILGATGYMLCYPGLTQIGTGSGIDRGANYNERFENQYRLSGTKLLSVAADGTTAILGTISGSEQATLKDFYSFNTQGIIADGKMFLYDPVGGFQEVTDTDLGDPIDGVWVNGVYFMTDGEYLFHTDVADETAIDPIKFATSEYSPDPTLGVSKTQDNKVMAWNRYTLEYFVDVRADTTITGFGFRRVETRAQKIGIVATHAKCESGGMWYITGGRKEDAVSVHVVTVGASTKISTREVDKILATYTEPQLADMRMESRMEDDVTFILIHLPNETLCFNENIAAAFGKNEAWSILKTDIAGNETYRAINGVNDARSSDWVYGDKRDSTIGKLDNTVFTHYGEAVEWLLFTPLMNLETMSIDEFEIETIPGHTVYNDATVAFSTTSDGLTYSTEYWCDYGDPLQYSKRFFKRRIGYVRDWIGFKFRGATKSRMSFALMKVTYS